MKAGVWTLMVCTYDERDPFLSVHESERECLLVVRENFDQEKGFDDVPDDPEFYDDWVTRFESFAGLRQVVIDKHDIEMGVEFYVARASSRHFDFEGVGQDEREARLALRVALERHFTSTPYCAWTTAERDEMADEATVQPYIIGASYRDGEVIRP